MLAHWSIYRELSHGYVNWLQDVTCSLSHPSKWEREKIGVEGEGGLIEDLVRAWEECTTLHERCALRGGWALRCRGAAAATGSLALCDQPCS